MSEKISRMKFDDRETIEIGVARMQPLQRIAELLNRHVASVAREIKRHRIFIPGSYFAGNDCKGAKGCTKRHLCGDDSCPMYCYTCAKDCHVYCDEYISTKCTKYDFPPYVCNGCEKRRNCSDDRYFYDAKVADRKSIDTRKTSRVGIHLSDEELADVNRILSDGIKKGQPLAHIFAVHEQEIPITSRTAYIYINDGILDVRNIDLRRQTRYKRRRKKKSESGILTHKFRQGRTYQDFMALMKNRSEKDVCEMDTVKGKRGQKKVLLTMLLRRNSVMIAFLIPDCTADSVIDRINYLERGLGKDCFNRLFGICLTDNGSEFKVVDGLEASIEVEGALRTNVYFCDPMQSGQKGRLEKNHEYIRYVIPKGTSLNSYTQEDITLLVNHINSTKRPGLNNLSPYEMIPDDDEDMRRLMKLLDLKEIPADKVNLTKELLNK
ncbi:IS30 family transposase [Butyrivibrio sp. VCB2001]|uniref:IS30 family transposase n=1 Tax=Butyrivibrio sp. VCB2001 TaxID=1280667 RepID=UPI0003F9A8A6|nr:IS30 family transposase [Butyrivibrio sp. VCB2001]